MSYNETPIERIEMFNRIKNLDPMTKTTIKVCAFQTAIMIVCVIIIVKTPNADSILETE
jgi:hypothetical protein